MGVSKNNDSMEYIMLLCTTIEIPCLGTFAHVP